MAKKEANGGSWPRPSLVGCGTWGLGDLSGQGGLIGHLAPLSPSFWGKARLWPQKGRGFEEAGPTHPYHMAP
jgi:hypothetical protein